MAEMLHKAMAYLGLVDDEYDEYAPDPSEQLSVPRSERAAAASASSSMDEAPQLSSIRTLSRTEREDPSAITITSSKSGVVRPISPIQTAKVHVVEPAGFSEAQEIGDRLRANQPVIVTLQSVAPDLSRRLIDFCSGATYVLGGAMERVAKNVFLLTPSNVEVSAEEKRRLQERGYYRS